MFCFFTQLVIPIGKLGLIQLFIYAFILAAASLEALFKYRSGRKIDKVRRYVSRNRELVAQGIGNTLAGLIMVFQLRQ